MRRRPRTPQAASRALRRSGRNSKILNLGSTVSRILLSENARDFRDFRLGILSPWISVSLMVATESEVGKMHLGHKWKGEGLDLQKHLTDVEGFLFPLKES